MKNPRIHIFYLLMLLSMEVAGIWAICDLARMNDALIVFTSEVKLEAVKAQTATMRCYRTEDACRKVEEAIDRMEEYGICR